jgi:LysM repeat protein
MKKELLGWMAVLSLSLALSACSASKTSSEDDFDDDEDMAQTADAGTDVVPVEAAEAPVAQAEEAVAQVPVEAPPPPAETPVPAPAQAPAPAPVATNGEFESYTVQPGDTLMKIAFEHYGDVYAWKKIEDANKDQLTNANQLRKGMVLKVEKPQSSPSIDRNGEKYLIKQGDTLGTISNDVYGTPKKWRKLWENNRQLIRDPNKIYAGFYMYYQPDGYVKPEPMASAPGGEPQASVQEVKVKGADKPAEKVVGTVSSVSPQSVKTIDTSWETPAANDAARAPSSAKN